MMISPSIQVSGFDWTVGKKKGRRAVSSIRLTGSVWRCLTLSCVPVQKLQDVFVMRQFSHDRNLCFHIFGPDTLRINRRRAMNSKLFHREKNCLSPCRERHVEIIGENKIKHFPVEQVYPIICIFMYMYISPKCFVGHRYVSKTGTSKENRIG